MVKPNEKPEAIPGIVIDRDKIAETVTKCNIAAEQMVAYLQSQLAPREAYMALLLAERLFWGVTDIPEGQVSKMKLIATKACDAYEQLVKEAKLKIEKENGKDKTDASDETPDNPAG